MPPTIYYHVALPVPLRDNFDYLGPSGLDGIRLSEGVRVKVPLGRRILVGMVVGTSVTTPVPDSRLKAIREVLDDAPLLPPPILALLRWAARYYRHPYGEVIRAAIPARLRSGLSVDGVTHSHWYASVGEMPSQLSKRAPRQAAVLGTLLDHMDTGTPAEVLNAEHERWRDAMRALVEKGLAERREQPCPGPPVEGPDKPHGSMQVSLNPGQTEASGVIRQAMGRFAPVLLDGVTGSGKTEVYLSAIEGVLASGRQALVLVPEIGLTPQLVDRFSTRLRVPLAVMHSGLSDTERHCAWRMAGTGRARVVIGTRSAVFTPLPQPGILIVDEEHDPSFKQQDGFRYNARDLAVYRAKLEGIPVVLGSATPSLESLANVTRGKYTSVALPERAGPARPPSVSIIDLRRHRTTDGVSGPLRERIAAHLERGGQVLLFLNRRGFAPALLCNDCGWAAPCSRCDSLLTLHAGQASMRCHHCGAQRSVPDRCEACGGSDLLPVGQGTERVERALREWFPQVPLVRIDRDTTRRKGALEGHIRAIRSGRHRILIGTQMLSKGHDFPQVTLTGILSLDNGLYATDFRASERLAQLIVQVAGRAGRADRPGEVCLQTHLPDHPLIQSLIHRGYQGFAQTALAERRAAGMPPFSHMALLRAEATARDEPMRLLETVRGKVVVADASKAVQFGPAPAPMERRAGRFRAQLMAIAPRRQELDPVVDQWLGELRENGRGRSVRWSLDIDPADVL
ncbi:MAG: primosomal protein N' [Pseudomonadota bacterium]|nr:primosomal protein N' [Pseudomonadota bacterium]